MRPTRVKIWVDDDGKVSIPDTKLEGAVVLEIHTHGEGHYTEVRHDGLWVVDPSVEA